MMQKLQNIKSRIPTLDAPLSLIYIAPYLLKEEFDVEILDLRISKLNTLKKYLRDKKPIVAGMSIMPGSALPLAIGINSVIKRYSPKTKVVWGGSFPSLHYELCLNIPDVDFVVCGDGEVTFTELALALKHFSNLQDISNIKGLAFKYNENVISTQPREPIDLDINHIGAWNLVDKYMSYYLGIHSYIAINTSRGCPHKCSFCYNNSLYKGFKKFRTKSITSVMEEVKYLVEKYSIKKIQFLDDDFLGNKKRGLELVSSLKNEYPYMNYHIKARSDELKSENIVKHLADTGLESVFIGAESGSEDQLLKIEKGYETNDTIEAAKLCLKYNIRPMFSFTCGYPNESIRDLYATVKMAKLLKNTNKKCHSFLEIISPVYGTPLYIELEKNNLLPELSPAKWCYLTDWKSAKQKPWINNGNFYEAFQLAFYLAFARSSGYDGGLRIYTKILSKWSQFRLFDKNFKLLPEYRLANYIIKKILWNL